MDYRLLEIVACPICHGKLFYNKMQQELICKFDSLAFPIRDGIPILIEFEGRSLSIKEMNP